MQDQPDPESPISRRLSQIDGLLAGFNIAASFDYRLSGQKQQQWDRLDELRGEMLRQWEGLAPLGVSPVGDDLEGFCGTAFFAYRNALAGLVPTDLPKTVALCGLSYAVSRILRREGGPCPENFLGEVQICLQCLERQEDRQMLEASMAKLWPPTEQVGQVSDNSLVQGWTCYPSSPARGATSSQPWQDPSSLPYYTPAASGFDVLPGGLPVAAHWADTSQPSLESLGSAPGGADFSVLGLTPYGSQSSMPATSWSDAGQVEFQVGALGQLEAKTEPGVASSAPTGPRQLQDTGLFKAIETFLDGSSTFLVLLSGNGKTAKDLSSCLSSNQERLKDKEELRTSYMEPLLRRENLSKPPCSTILSTTNKFVAYGCLQSIDEAQSYMTTVAEVLFHDKAAQKLFCDSIKALPTLDEQPGQTCRCLVSTKPGSVRCPNCRKMFSKKANMIRHQKNSQCPVKPIA